MSSSPDLFTTLRYIPSGGSTPKKTNIPLFDRHVQRLRKGVEHFGELESKEEEDEVDWEMEVWRVLEQAILEKGVCKGLRVSLLCLRDVAGIGDSGEEELTSLTFVFLPSSQLKVTVVVSSPPSFKAEAWILPDTFRKLSTHYLPSRQTNL